MRGYDLVALIFAREVSDPLNSLVKTIDKQLGESAARHKTGSKLGVFVVFCSNDPGLKQQLQALIAKQGLKNIVLSINAPYSRALVRYRIASQADLTVVVYAKHERVAANFVVDSEDLTEAMTTDILNSLKKVLP